MIADFTLYMKSFDNFLTITRNVGAQSNEKKALLQAVGGPDMVWLFDFVGKVTAEMTYDVALTNIRAGITGQTNQAMMRYKLFTQMLQGKQPFSSM